MPVVGVERNDGEFYTNTTVVIPLRLKKEAKERGLSISRICTNALHEVLDDGDAEIESSGC